MKILVADDDPTSRLIVQVALRSLGHECHTVADGAQAWDAFQWGRPDVVISDWIMPRMTGLDLCRKIRGRASGSYTYFIMVTTQGGADEILEGMSAGVDDYLVKPLDSDSLQARLIAAARVTAEHRHLADERNELEHINQDLAALARCEPLTGLGNRRALKEDLEGLEARVNRYGHSYCMALLDVDHFKAYNDTYGHQAGDLVLQAVARELKAQARGATRCTATAARSSSASSPSSRSRREPSRSSGSGPGSSAWPSRTRTRSRGSSPSARGWPSSIRTATARPPPQCSRKLTRPCTGRSSWAATGSSGRHTSPPDPAQVAISLASASSTPALMASTTSP